MRVIRCQFLRQRNNKLVFYLILSNLLAILKFLKKNHVVMLFVDSQKKQQFIVLNSESGFLLHNEQKTIPFINHSKQ